MQFSTVYILPRTQPAITKNQMSKLEFRKVTQPYNTSTIIIFLDPSGHNFKFR